MSSNNVEKENELHRALKAIHFKAVTAYTRLKKDVSSLDVANSSVVGGRGGYDVGELGQEFKRTLEEYSVSVSNESVATQKIVRDFQSLLHKCEMLMKEYREKQKQKQKQRGVVAGTNNTGITLATVHVNQQQEQELLEMPPSATVAAIQESELFDPVVAYNEAIIRERDVAMTNISTQIGEVHQIFQDLAVLVHDQGDMVDDIESHVTRAAYKTQEAHTQLRRAEHHQRRAAKNWCFLAMLGIGACAVLLLVILS